MLIDGEEYYMDENNLYKDKDYHKKYNMAHKLRIAEKQRIYRLTYVVRTNCECGGKYTNVNKHTHFRTKKHIMYKKHFENIPLSIRTVRLRR